MKKRILIADEDPSVRKALGKVLEEEGYDIILAADGDEVLQGFEAGSVDLVLLDIGLPIKNGWDKFDCVMRLVPALPIIILTGRANQYDVDVAAGIGALMEKPLDVGKLLQTTKELLTESQEARLHRLCVFRLDRPYLPSQPADRQSAS